MRKRLVPGSPQERLGTRLQLLLHTPIIHFAPQTEQGQEDHLNHAGLRVQPPPILTQQLLTLS